MRTRAIVLVALAALALAGCGAHHLVLRVDVLSYMNPAETTVAFGPVPAAPGGLATGEVALIEDQDINLVEGMSNVAEVQSVTLELAAVVRDSTGSGLDTLRIYLSGEGVEPRNTAPILEQAVVLAPGETDSIHVVVPCDARVGELFVQRRMRLRVTMSARGPESGDPLNGRVTMRQLDAIIIAGRKSF